MVGHLPSAQGMILKFQDRSHIELLTWSLLLPLLVSVSHELINKILKKKKYSHLLWLLLTAYSKGEDRNDIKMESVNKKGSTMSRFGEHSQPIRFARKENTKHVAK